MDRRAKGTGHLSSKPRASGLYEAVWYDSAGKRHTLYGRDRKELTGRLARAIEANSEGITAGLERLTLAQYLSQWLKDYQKRIKPSTWVRTEELLRLHVVPRAGRVRMQAVLVQEMRSLQTELLGPRPRGAGLAPRTVNQTFSYLHVAFHDAEPHIRRLGTNPIDHVPPLAVRDPDPVALDDETVHHLLATSRQMQPRWYPFYALLAVTGLDVGMALALRRGDFDLLTGSYNARRSVRRVKGYGLMVWEPKTRARKRDGDLPKVMIAILQDHLAVLEAERAQATRDERPWDPETADLVFPLERVGGLKDPGIVTNHHWQKVLTAADLAPRSVKLKDFRSTVATVMDEEGVTDSTKQKILGHAQGSPVTRHNYVRVGDPQRRRAADAVGLRLLEGGLRDPLTGSPPGA